MNDRPLRIISGRYYDIVDMSVIKGKKSDRQWHSISLELVHINAQ